MSQEPISPSEQQEVQELFGQELNQLKLEDFERLHKALRQKYHPDKFEQYEDEVVREMANEKFKRIELLAEKVKKHLSTDPSQRPKDPKKDSVYDEFAEFAFEKMKIEMITREKDFKYLLFGSKWRWLERGDTYKVPDTQASIIMDQNHQGRSIGFTETIRIYLTFDKSDSLDVIVTWLYSRIQGQTSALIIEGERIPVELDRMLAAMRRKSFLGIAGETSESPNV